MCSNCGWDQDYEIDEENQDYEIDEENQTDLGEHETDISDEGYCTKCGKEHPSIKEINGEQLCADCRRFWYSRCQNG